MAVVIVSKSEPWPVSIVAMRIGSHSPGLVQCWGKISLCCVDRFKSVAATVIVTPAAMVLVTAIVTVSVSVPVAAPCCYCFHHSFG